MSHQHCADRLAEAVCERQSQLVLGLDPDPRALWPAALAFDTRGGDPQAKTAEATVAHCRFVIEATASACVAVKLQLACFERLGAPGWSALEAVAAVARDHGLAVIADGKRGDVPHTARAYAEGLVTGTDGPFGRVPGLGVDAFTVNPLLGADSLEPFVTAAAAGGALCFCLVLSSNPGAADLQQGPADDELYERIAHLVGGLAKDHVGRCGLSSVGAVVAATRPTQLVRLRELLPQSVFLLPGVGAQGAVVDSLGEAFAPHPAAGLVTVSRSIVQAYERLGGEPAEAARSEAERLRAQVWTLASGQIG